jgi:hypothetical protein
MRIAATQSTPTRPHGNLQQCHIPLQLFGHAAYTLVSEGGWLQFSSAAVKRVATNESSQFVSQHIHHRKAILTHDHLFLTDAKTLDGSRDDQNHHHHNHHSQCLGRVWNRSRFASPRIAPGRPFSRAGGIWPRDDASNAQMP